MKTQEHRKPRCSILILGRDPVRGLLVVCDRLLLSAHYKVSPLCGPFGNNIRTPRVRSWTKQTIFSFSSEASIGSLALELRAVSAHMMLYLETLIRHVNAQKPAWNTSSDAQEAFWLLTLSLCSTVQSSVTCAGQEGLSHNSMEVWSNSASSRSTITKSIMEHWRSIQILFPYKKIISQSFWQPRNQPADCPVFSGTKMVLYQREPLNRGYFSWWDERCLQAKHGDENPSTQEAETGGA